MTPSSTREFGRSRRKCTCGCKSPGASLLLLTLDVEILTLHIRKLHGKGVVTTGKQWTFVSYEVDKKTIYVSDPLPLTEREEDVATVIGVLRSWVRVPLFLSIR